MPRIASLIASSTEIVHALGFGAQQVARSHECDWPPEVGSLPAVTEPRFPTDGKSGEIDRRIKAILRDTLSVYRVDPDALREVDPEVILTQTQCEVCAVSLADVERALEGWLGERPTLVALAPNALADVWGDVRKVAAALGAPERGAALVAELEARMAAVAARAATLPERPSVACIEWIEPLMAAGNWMPELVAMAGGRNLFGEVGRHSPWMAWDDLVAADPDVLVIVPCGFDVAKTREEMSPLTNQPEWLRLTAVRNGRVALADGVSFFNRPGPRLAESLEILSEILHPAEFGERWHGRGWELL